MSEDTKKATYINLFLLAAADGRICPEEREYLTRYARIAGISPEQEREWQGEVESGRVEFRQIDDRRAATEAIALLARMVRVDGEFDPAEQEVFIAMGKALGFSADELGPILRAYWDKDPLAHKETGKTTPPRETNESSRVSVLKEDFPDLEQLRRSAPEMQLRFCSFGELTEMSPPPAIVVFHLAEQKADSEKRLDEVKRRAPDAYVAFIARRDQAPQIGWMLGLGANRCFVEPLYPRELENALRALPSDERAR